MDILKCIVKLDTVYLRDWLADEGFKLSKSQFKRFKQILKWAVINPEYYSGKEE